MLNVAAYCALRANGGRSSRARCHDDQRALTVNTVSRAFMTSAYVSVRRAKGTITDLPSWSCESDSRRPLRLSRAPDGRGEASRLTQEVAAELENSPPRKPGSYLQCSHCIGCVRFQVRKYRRAAVIARDRVVVSYRRQRVRRFQVRINRKAATMANPAITFAHRYPDSLTCVVARADVAARRADESVCPLVAVSAPVHLPAASQAAHGLVERVWPDFSERGVEVGFGIVDGPLGDSPFTTSPRIICPPVHDHQGTHAEVERPSNQVSNNHHQRRWTPADIDGRPFPGQTSYSPGSPHRYLASGRRGHEPCRRGGRIGLSDIGG